MVSQVAQEMGKGNYRAQCVTQTNKQDKTIVATKLERSTFDTSKNLPLKL
jgi:hypothetical protein